MKEWSSFDELFTTLNNSEITYVILRNFEEIKDFNSFVLHPDIDFLCDDSKKMNLLLGATPRNKNKDLVHSKICLCGNIIPVDIRSVGDGYYDKSWEQMILDNRETSEHGFYVPNREDYYYSLCYHAIFHKKSISEEYDSKLNDLRKIIDLDIKPGDVLDDLENYMRIHNFWYTFPRNYYGFLNTKNVDPKLIKPVSRLRLKIQSIIKHSNK